MAGRLPGALAGPLAVIAPAAARGFETREEGGAAVLRTPRLTARVTLATGEVAFEDEAGRPLLREPAGGGRTLTPVRTFGEETLAVRQEFEGAPGESLYGLGQHQDRLLDLAGRDLDLWQHNREIVVPFLVSTRRWGLLWDNPAHMRFGRPEDVVALPASAAVDESGQPRRFTASFFADRELREAIALPPPSGIGVPPASGPETMAFGGPPTSLAPVSLPPEIVSTCLSARWTGFLDVPRTGEYALSVADAVGVARLWIDGRLAVDYWSPFLKATDVARLRLEAGRRHAFRLEWKRSDAGSTMAFKWLPPREARPPISLWSASAEGVDYVFVRGETLDEVIAGYRELTGRAALPPRWALGYWQSRERYRTADELVGTVKEFRARRFPLDVIVQDWHYWRDGDWGSHELDPSRFPDPKAMTEGIHALGARVMISVWPKFYPGTANFDELQKAGHLYPLSLATQTKDWLGPGLHPLRRLQPRGTAHLLAAGRAGALHEGHRRLVARRHRARGPAEPGAGRPRHPHEPTALGPGARVLNAYPLMASRAACSRASAARRRTSAWRS